MSFKNTRTRRLNASLLSVFLIFLIFSSAERTPEKTKHRTQPHSGGEKQNRASEGHHTEDRHTGEFRADQTEWCGTAAGSQKDAGDIIGVCLAPECVEVAGRMLSLMDQSADPCDDFYQFSCGGYLRDVYKPGIHRKVSLDQNDLLKLRLISLLQGKDLDQDPPELDSQHISAIEKAKLYFSTCMSDTNDDTNFRRITLQLIKELHLSTLTSETSSRDIKNGWNLEETIAKLLSMGFDPLFKVEVIRDPSNTTRHILKLSASGLSVNPSLFHVISSLGIYSYESLLKRHINRVLTEVYGYDTVSELIVDEVVGFETDLSDIQPSTFESDLMETNQVLKLETLQIVIPELNLTRLLNTFLNTAGKSLSPDTEIIVESVEYFQDLNDMISDYQTLEPNAIAQYLTWNLIHNVYLENGGEFKLSLFDYSWTNYLHNQKTDKEKSDYNECLQNTNKAFPYAVAALYSGKFLKHSRNDQVKEIGRIVLEELRSLMNEADWLDDETRTEALLKVENIVLKIGYPDFITDEHYLNEYYINFLVSGDKLQNALELRKFKLLRKMKDYYGSDYHREKWREDEIPATSDAHYNYKENAVTLCAGYMDPSLFNPNLPPALLYGTTAFTLAHEVMHGFDIQSRKYDYLGQKFLWWSEESEQEQDSLAECFQWQYSQNELEGKEVDGDLTLNENIADNGGIRLAYNALKRSQNENVKLSQTLPGLNLTSDQLFFLTYAQQWCEYVPSILVTARLKDEHAPGKFRVNTVVQNYEKFSGSFSCPKGTPMNPKRRCRVW